MSCNNHRSVTSVTQRQSICFSFEFLYCTKKEKQESNSVTAFGSPWQWHKRWEVLDQGFLNLFDSSCEFCVSSVLSCFECFMFGHIRFFDDGNI